MTGRHGTVQNHEANIKRKKIVCVHLFEQIKIIIHGSVDPVVEGDGSRQQGLRERPAGLRKEPARQL